MSFKFRAAADIDWEKKSSYEPQFGESWDDAAKEELCQNLLTEFGIDVIQSDGLGNLTVPCPFPPHRNQAQSPTGSLNFRKLLWNCFGACGTSGSVLWFVGQMRDISEEEARKWLRQWSGKEGEEGESIMDFFNKLYSDDGPLEEPIPRMSAAVLEPWVQKMQDNLDLFLPVMNEKWRIPEDNIKKYRVGVGDFKGSIRYVFPHFWEGDLVGWQTRRIGDDGTPKYMASTGFPKDRTIFSYHPRESEVVVVESPMSVVSKGHLIPISATIGAKVTKRQTRLLSMHSDVIVFADNDKAGFNMTEALGEDLAGYSSVWVAPNPYDADPADLDDDTYLSILESRVPFSLWEPPSKVEEWQYSI